MTATARGALVVVTCAFSVACLENAPTSPQASVPQFSSQVPFREDYHSSGTISASPNCPLGTLLVLLEGAGTATHLGRYTITNSHCLSLTTGMFTNGTFVKTAADGSQLFGTYSGSGTVLVPPSPVGRFLIGGTLAFTGGTGRFAGATGALSMEGVQTTDFSLVGFPTEVALRMKGTISSLGSRNRP